MESHQPTEDARVSEPMRRVVEALLSGEPPQREDQEALSPAEQQELAAITRTAHLAAITLEKPTPPEGSEARSLERSAQALQAKPPRPAPKPEPTWLSWWRRLRNGSHRNNGE
ncbi:MAG: hypothetical protein OHK0029_27350 [Armatimonadaceae bacterium]